MKWLDKIQRLPLWAWPLMFFVLCWVIGLLQPLGGFGEV